MSDIGRKIDGTTGKREGTSLAIEVPERRCLVESCLSVGSISNMGRPIDRRSDSRWDRISQITIYCGSGCRIGKGRRKDAEGGGQPQ